MPLESASRIDQLDPSNPTSGDQLAQADDHLRLIKKALQGTFPNIKGVVTPTHQVINGLDGRTTALEDNVVKKDGSVAFTGHQSMGGNRLTNLGAPTSSHHAATKKYVDDTASALQDDFIEALEKVWPVGSIYMNGSVNTNPATLLGFGVWERFAQGRVLLGAGSYTDSRGETRDFSRGATGGTYRHKLTVAEMPRHSHSTTATESRRDGGGNSPKVLIHSSGQTGEAGGDQPHNNMQPYITVVIWRRTA